MLENCVLITLFPTFRRFISCFFPMSFWEKTNNKIKKKRSNFLIKEGVCFIYCWAKKFRKKLEKVRKFCKLLKLLDHLKFCWLLKSISIYILLTRSHILFFVKLERTTCVLRQDMKSCYFNVQKCLYVCMCLEGSDNLAWQNIQSQGHKKVWNVPKKKLI